MKARETAIVYVDGFNLYRRALEGLPGVKWLNLEVLCRHLLPDFDLIAVEYFTANLKPGTVDDPNSVPRQQTYLRALRTLSNVRIHLGTFRADKRVLTILPKTFDPTTGEPMRVTVLKIEEKGSDVNLAARMVADSLTNRADVVVLLSNDSDHVGQISMLTNEFQKRVGVISPFQEEKRASKHIRSLNLEFFGSSRAIPC